MTGGARVLCVCTHNRTRSVMMGALLSERGRQLAPPLLVRTAGFQDRGQPPTDGAIDMLRRNGLDASDHLSALVTVDVASSADLVLTAEQQHVVSIASLGSGLFDRTFTLPEFVAIGWRIGPRDGAPIEEWLAELAADRPRGIDYLSADVGEVADPTGQRPSDWRNSWATIASLVDSATALLA